MDILVILLLFALYVIPEVLRRTRKPKTYKYPEFPTNEPAEKPTTAIEIKRKYSISDMSAPAAPKTPAHTAGPNAAAFTTRPAAPPIATVQTEEPIELDGFAYGFVMAEIIGPPRSVKSHGRSR